MNKLNPTVDDKINGIEITQLGLYCAGVLGRKIADSRIEECHVCQREKHTMEVIQVRTSDDVIKLAPVCWDCGAPQLEFATSGDCRNEPCACGSGKKYKNCCLQLVIRSNEVTDFDPRIKNNSST